MIGVYLDLSTGHLTRATMELLEDQDASRNCGWPAMTIAPYEHGAFITVPSDAEPEQWDALPADMREVLSFASNLGIAVLRFDSDGDEIDSLSFYRQ